MNPIHKLHHEFAKVIACERCSLETCANLLRDQGENVAQPGYIGSNYSKSRVLLVGQNPGTPKSREVLDRPYTAALRALRDEPSHQTYSELCRVLRNFIPHWPVTNNYFPLSESGLTLDEIAYCNIIRCRTESDKKPNRKLAQACIEEHFEHWLNFLQPAVVIFIGKWASEYGQIAVRSRGIPFAHMNRQRNLSSSERFANRSEVVALVQRFRIYS